MPTTDVDVASDREDMPPGPEDQSEGEIVDSEEDPADAGIPRLDNLKMTEEEQRDFDTFSLASVTVPKRPWRAQEDSNVSKPQPQNIRQARPVIPQAVAKAQSIKSAQSDQRSAQGQPVSRAQFPVLVPQGQGPSQGQGRPVITNDPYVLSIVAKGYRLRFTSPPPSPPNPLGDQIPPGARGNSRHAGTNHSHASEERNNRGASELPRILLKGIPGTQSFRRMASSYRSKKSERPHSCTSFPYVHYKLSSELRSKRRLHVQNKSAGCVLSCTYPSQQQKVPQVRLREQGVPVSGATLRSEHSPSGFYWIGAHGDRLSSPSGDLGDTVSR